MGCLKLTYYPETEPKINTLSEELTLKISSERLRSFYLFGFNGKENDNEVKGDGGQQDYGERIYDPRLGRFLSPDPIIVYEHKYPELSTYQFASNSPISGIDLDGKEYVHYDVIKIEKDGKCIIKPTGVKEYKHWLLDLTDGLWGLWDNMADPVKVVKSPFNGKNYFFGTNEEVYVADFNDSRWTDERLSAAYKLTDATGKVMTPAMPAKGNETIDVVSDGLGKVQQAAETIKTSKRQNNSTNKNQASTAKSNNAKSSNSQPNSKGKKNNPKSKLPKPKSAPCKPASGYVPSLSRTFQ